MRIYILYPVFGVDLCNTPSLPGCLPIYRPNSIVYLVMYLWRGPLIEIVMCTIVVTDVVVEEICSHYDTLVEYFRRFPPNLLIEPSPTIFLSIHLLQFSIR